MNVFNALNLLLVLSCLSLGANAEGSCPPGQYPIGNRDVAACAPLPSGGDQQAPIAPAPIWEDRFGSIASDAARGVFESVIEMSSATEARSAALANCKTKGGKNCETLLTYYNGCAVIMFGDNAYVADTGGTVAGATQNALKKCSELTKNCHVEYSICSHAERIR